MAAYKCLNVAMAFKKVSFYYGVL